MKQNLKDKLSRVERSVNMYLKDSNEPLHEISLDTIPFEKLKEIVKPNEDDPLLYDGYELTEEQLIQINRFLENEKIMIDFRKYEYILICGGIYNWTKE